MCVIGKAEMEWRLSHVPLFMASPGKSEDILFHLISQRMKEQIFSLLLDLNRVEQTFDAKYG